MRWIRQFGKERENVLDRLRDELDMFADQFFRSRLWPRLWPDDENLQFFPSINIREKSGKYVVEAEIPGVDPDEVQIEVRDRMLVIKGEKRTETETQDEQVHMIEHKYGAFNRRVQLPDDAVTDDITAKCKNGVLYIDIPKDKKKESKKIQIEKAE